MQFNSSYKKSSNLKLIYRMNNDIDFESRREMLISQIDILQKEIKIKNNDVGDLLNQLQAIQQELLVLMKNQYNGKRD